MIPDLDSFLDFCITCDRQVEEGHLYCCEDCRMAEHDESSRSSSAASSPRSPGGLSTWTTAPPGMPLYLAPGYNFRHAVMIRKATTAMPVRSAAVSIHRPRPTPCFLPAAPAPAPSKWPGFLPAAPESSKWPFVMPEAPVPLTSHRSMPVQQPTEPTMLSDGSAKALKAYAEAFDSSRYSRRQST